jgi:hypothetical protein
MVTVVLVIVLAIDKLPEVVRIPAAVPVILPVEPMVTPPAWTDMVNVVAAHAATPLMVRLLQLPATSIVTVVPLAITASFPDIGTPLSQVPGVFQVPLVIEVVVNAKAGVLNNNITPIAKIKIIVL